MPNGGARVSLNIDLGEVPGEPAELFKLATVVNIACGGHAGDAASIRLALELAAAGGARIAAHPSYPDREGFGRRTRFTAGALLDAALEEQLERIKVAADRAGVAVVAMKPHGAMYHDASVDAALAGHVIDAAARILGRVAIVGPPHGCLGEVAAQRGLTFSREGFADRRYDRDGGLVPRSVSDALITDPTACSEQALALARSGRFDTLCVHADTPGAHSIARAVREALSHEGLLTAC